MRTCFLESQAKLGSFLKALRTFLGVKALI